MSNAQLGEQLVGAYQRLVNQCEVVSYNEFSEKVGDQMEIDVLAIKTVDGEQSVHVCEVVTHLDGIHYGGKPSDDYWSEFGSTSYQGTLDTIYQKFLVDHEYVSRVFDDADEYQFQLWAPYVAKGKLTAGLEQMITRFHEERDEQLELKINEEYTAEIDELREKAGNETKRYGEPAFRFLQILEHMRR
ncbi:hypothetical protein [Natrinema sp. SYSU A 869]|uniref:hypothetical protein n=1 Tax=Natrinema sp. SYSU A 869 TaxID=2871694 RepID=UPI001CA44A48|nr:hypothetical protein [Natrinema sp. SYSU A 869]